MEMKTSVFSAAAMRRRERWPLCKAPIVGTRPTVRLERSRFRRNWRNLGTSRKTWRGWIEEADVVIGEVVRRGVVVERGRRRRGTVVAFG